MWLYISKKASSLHVQLSGLAHYKRHWFDRELLYYYLATIDIDVKIAHTRSCLASRVVSLATHALEM